MTTGPFDPRYPDDPLYGDDPLRGDFDDGDSHGRGDARDSRDTDSFDPARPGGEGTGAPRRSQTSRQRAASDRTGEQPVTPQGGRVGAGNTRRAASTAAAKRTKAEREAEEERAYRVKRHRRTTATLLVLLLALAGAFYYASTYWRDSAPKPQACTTEVPTKELAPADVTISVYNATKKNGLALALSKLMAARGFKIKGVGNDPKAIAGVAEIRHGPTGKSSAEVVAKHIPGATLVAIKREDDTVDVVIGNKYSKLGPVPKETVATSTAPLCPTVTVTG